MCSIIFYWRRKCASTIPDFFHVACVQFKMPNHVFPSCREGVHCSHLTSSASFRRDEGCRGGAPGPQGGSEVQARRRGTRPGPLRRAGSGLGRRGGLHDAPRWRYQRRRRRRWIQPGAGEQQRSGEAAAAEQQQREPVRSTAVPETEAAPDPLHPGAAQRAGEELRQNALPRHLHAGGAGSEDRPDGVPSAGRTPGSTACSLHSLIHQQWVVLKQNSKQGLVLLLHMRVKQQHTARAGQNEFKWQLLNECVYFLKSFITTKSPPAAKNKTQSVHCCHDTNEHAGPGI